MRSIKNIHFMGIGGSGASAIAAIALSEGYKVTGCDKKPDNDFTRGFSKSILYSGHSPKHLKNCDLLIKTPAIHIDNFTREEIKSARKKKTPILTWQQFMSKYLQKGKFVIAVCGTHGKSTTTAMTGLLLENAGFDPTVELGAIVPRWNKNHLVGNGNYFVTEADEYHNNFKSITPDVTVLTSIEMDHPGFFKNFTEVRQTFLKFISRTKKTIIANLSDPVIVEVISHLDQKSNLKIIDYSKKKINFKLRIPGNYNLLNASSVYQVGLELGIKPKIIKKSLQSYSGISRRFEYLGDFQGAKIYSDFGHHPSAIRVTMLSAKEKFPDKRLILVFQPHLFSRTKTLFKDFVQVFKELPVDKIILTDIYASREKDNGLITSRKLAAAVGNDRLVYHSKDQLKQIIDSQVQKDDVVFFMGAGDIDNFAKTFI